MCRCVQCLLVTGVLVSYCLIYAPFIRQVDKSIKRTRALLLLFPNDVIMNVPAIAALVRQYATSRQSKR